MKSSLFQKNICTDLKYLHKFVQYFISLQIILIFPFDS